MIGSSVGDVINSLREILYFLRKEDNRDTRMLMYSDLEEKISHLAKLKPELGIETAFPKKASKRQCDIVVFTVVPVEFDNFCRIFNVDNTKNPELDLNGLWFYRFEIELPGKKNISGLVTMIGKAGGINASLACFRTFQAINAKMYALVGIAAGVRDVLPLYSAIVVKGIVDYEFQRVEEEGITYRVEPFTIRKTYENYCNNMGMERMVDKWRSHVESSLKIVNDQINGSRNFTEGLKLEVGVIASGAKLLADGKTLKTLREEIPIGRGIVGAEMEGNGFCPTCEELEVNWMSFRGVSDHGSADKNALNKEKQYLAVHSACAALRLFIENYPMEDPRSF